MSVQHQSPPITVQANSRSQGTSAGHCARLGDDRHRAETYLILARLLGATPSAELLAYLADIPNTNAPETADSTVGLAAHWQALAQQAQQCEADALDDEYHDLFVGLGRGQVMPYGSWHLTGFMMEKPLSDLRVDLRALGFAVQQDSKEPEDHLAALFETMSMLIQAEDISDQQQADFFQRHIEPWVNRFCDDLSNAPSTRFYAPVADLVKSFMAFESTYLTLPTD